MKRRTVLTHLSLDPDVVDVRFEPDKRKQFRRSTLPTTLFFGPINVGVIAAARYSEAARNEIHLFPTYTHPRQVIDYVRAHPDQFPGTWTYGVYR